MSMTENELKLRQCAIEHLCKPALEKLLDSRDKLVRGDYKYLSTDGRNDSIEKIDELIKEILFPAEISD